MSLAEDLAAEAPGPREAIAEFYANLSDQDRAEFDNWVAADRSLTRLWRHCCNNGLNCAAPSTFRDYIVKWHSPQTS